MKREQLLGIGFAILSFLLGLGSVYMMRDGSPILSLVFLLFFALPGVIGVVQEKGGKAGGLLVLGLVVFAYVVESIAVKTGWPYGFFTYSEMMGPAPFHLSPLLTPLAFVPLVLGAFAVMTRLKWTDLMFIFGAGVFLVAVDFLLDPGAVAQGLWTYQRGGFFNGVPSGNFMGWMFTGSLVAFLFRTSVKSIAPLVGIFGIIAFWTAVAIAYGFVLPVIAGVALTALTGSLMFRRV